jgi:hypothetical protein
MDEPRAILFVSQGIRFNFESKNLMDRDNKEQFVYADDFESLFIEITARVNRALCRGVTYKVAA